MKKVLDKVLKTCYNKSIESKIDRAYHVVACIFNDKGRILTVKTNEYKTHPIAKDFGYEYPYLHAELNAAISHGLDDCHGLNILVFRITPKQKRITMAKPCGQCLSMLRTLGFRKVYYTDWLGNLQEL